MKELGQFNLENGETGLGKHGMGRGSLQIIRRPPVLVEGIYLATEDRRRIGYRDTDFDSTSGTEPYES